MTRGGSFPLSACFRVSVAVLASFVTAHGSAREPFESPVPAQQGQEANRTGTGLILGRVVDMTRDGGVANARVVLSGPALGSSGRLGPDGVLGGPRQVQSDAQGTFLFHGLPPGRYRLSASATGFLDGAYGRTEPRAAIGRVLDITREIELHDGEQLGDVRIPMFRHGLIEGRVVDEAGEPIVELRVTIVARVPTWAGPMFVASRTATTDDRGFYRAEVVPGEYLVAALAEPTTVPASMLAEHAEAAAEGPTVARELARRRALLGAPGPIDAGVRVGDHVVGQPLSGGPPPLPALDAEGRLMMFPTTYYPAARTFAAGEVLTIRSGDSRTGVDLQLRPEPTFRVSGTVMGPDGPAASVGVRLYRAALLPLISPPGFMYSMRGSTDAHGRFLLLGVSPGDYILRVTTYPGSPRPQAGDDARWGTLPVIVDDADRTDLTLTLQAGARFIGHVVYEGGKPPAPSGAPIAIRPRPMPGTLANFAEPQSVATLEPDGRFATPRLPPGQYLFEVTRVPRGWALKSVMVDGRDGSDVLIDLTGADLKTVVTLTNRVSRVTGTARHADGTIPETAAVVVFAADPAYWPRVGLGSRRQRVIVAAADGIYSLEGLPAGDYYIASVSRSAEADFTDPENMRQLIPLATRIAIADGAVRQLDIRVVELRGR